MAKKETGKIVQYGNTPYIPIPASIVKDSLYSEVGIKKGDEVEIEIVGKSLKVRLPEEEKQEE